MQQQLDQRFKSVADLVAKAADPQTPVELQNYLVRLGAVLICGNIERSIEIIILTRLHQRAHPRVLTFVKSHFARGRNFDCAAIEQLLLRFDPDWYRKFAKFVEDNAEVKEGVSSCYSVRNSVAHGGTMGLGSKRLEELLDVSKRLLDAVVTVTA